MPNIVASVDVIVVILICWLFGNAVGADPVGADDVAANPSAAIILRNSMT